MRYIIYNGLYLLGFLPVKIDNTNDLVISIHPESVSDKDFDISLYVLTSSRAVALLDLVFYTLHSRYPDEKIDMLRDAMEAILDPILNISQYGFIALCN